MGRLDDRVESTHPAQAAIDGKTLRFSKPIALPERRDTSMPLVLRVKP